LQTIFKPAFIISRDWGSAIIALHTALGARSSTISIVLADDDTAATVALRTARAPLRVVEETIHRARMQVGLLALRDVWALGIVAVRVGVEQVASPANLSRVRRIDVATDAGVAPLRPRTELTRLFAWGTGTVLLICRDLADTTTIGRCGDDITMTGLEIETTVVNTIVSDTAFGWMPRGPVGQDARHGAWVFVATLLFNKVDLLLTLGAVHQENPSAGLVWDAPRNRASGRARTEHTPFTDQAFLFTCSENARFKLSEIRTFGTTPLRRNGDSAGFGLETDTAGDRASTGIPLADNAVHRAGTERTLTSVAGRNRTGITEGRIAHKKDSCASLNDTGIGSTAGWAQAPARPIAPKAWCWAFLHFTRNIVREFWANRTTTLGRDSDIAATNTKGITTRKSTKFSFRLTILNSTIPLSGLTRLRTTHSVTRLTFWGRRTLFPIWSGIHHDVDVAFM